MSKHFKMLSDKELRLIDDSRVETRFKKKEIIFKQGAPISHVIFLSQGYVKIFIVGIDKRDLILGITGSTQYITGPGLYYKGVYSYSAMALSDVTACYVDKEVFKHLVVTNAEFANTFLEEFCRRSINTIESYVNNTQKKMPGRVAGGLIYLSNAVFNSSSFDMFINREELGELTGMSKESVVRVLSDFKSEGLIKTRGNHIEIINKERLSKISHYG